MRKEYGAALRRGFTTALRAAFPEFEPVALQSMYVFPGERLFRWVPFEPLHCWIILVPGRTGGESFSVEIAWSARARFPELSMRPSPETSGGSRDEHALRIRRPSDPAEVWWRLPDPVLDTIESGRAPDELVLRAAVEPIPAARAAADVAPGIAEAIELLRVWGVPYLQRIAAERR